MAKTSYKSSPVFQQSFSLDGNIINGVVIVQEGVDKVGDYFDKQFLSQLVEQGNSYPQGVKSRFGHPNMCKDSLGTYIGRYKNFRYESNTDGRGVVKADLHLDNVAQRSPDGNLYDYVKAMSTTNPDMFGNSIVFSATSVEHEADGQVYNKFILEQFMASDLVDSPAATDNLFKSSKDVGVIITGFLDEHPEVLEVMANNPDILGDFIQKRYIPYLKIKNKNSDMSILKNVQALFGVKFKNVEATLEDGTVLTIITDADDPAVGDMVEIDGQPAPDGEHTINDGSKIVTVNGAITEIIPAEEPAPADPAPADPVTDPVVMESIKSIKDENKKLRSIVETQSKNIAEMQKAIQFIAKSVGSKYTPGVAEPAQEGQPKKDRSLKGNK